MKNLIRHLIQLNLDAIVSKSIMHCHVKGLHSIMLIDKPEQRVRLYYAAENHNDLYLNNPVQIDEPMSLGYHQHHCDIILEVLHGQLTNINAREVWKDSVDPHDKTHHNIWHPSDDSYKRFEYKSFINDVKHGFVTYPYQDRMLVYDGIHQLNPGQIVALPAKQFHTVWCPKDTFTAWLVVEGKEDATYNPITYSNDNLEHFDTEGMYQPATVGQVMFILNRCFFLDDVNQV